MSQSTEYKNNFAKENYDRVLLVLPKGKKNEITKYYREKGYKSFNQYINTLIENDMNQNGGGALNRWENRAGVSIFLRIAKGTSILRAPLAETPFGRLRGRAP